MDIHAPKRNDNDIEPPNTNSQYNNQYAIWIVLGIALVARLVTHFIADNGNTTTLDATIIAADLAIGYVIYRIATKTFDGSWSTVFSAAWLFNPAAVFSSAAAGIVEPVFVLFMILLLAWLRGKIYSVIFVVVLPVALQLRFWGGGVEYGTVSAFNFYSLIGRIGWAMDTGFLGFTYYVWGAVLTLVIVVGAAVAVYADIQQDSGNYFLIIGAYLILLFTFSTGMYAAALFPGIAFLLVHFVKQKDARVLGLYLAFSATLLINLFQMRNFGGYGFRTPYDFMMLASLANVFFGFVLVIVTVNSVWPKFNWLAPPGTPRQGIPTAYYIWILLLVGFIVRAVLVVNVDFAFDYDVGLFRRWGNTIFQYGFASYYTSYHFVTDYPPVYLYVLYVIAALRSVFDWEIYNPVYNFILFLPAILCDLGIGYMLHRRAEKTQRPYSRAHMPTLLTAFWVLNPAILLVSSVWGQVESAFVLPLMLSVLLLKEKKLLPAYLLFGVAILTKPQSLFIAPVYLYSAIAYLNAAKIVDDKSVKKFNWAACGRLFGYIFAAVALMLLIIFPFDLPVAFRALVYDVGGRMYATINAFNFFNLVGGNWRTLDNRFAGVSYGIIGIGFALTIIFGSLAALHADHQRGGRHFNLITASLFTLIFVFVFRMHERYLFPALPFLLLYIIEERDRRVLGLYVGFSVAFFINCIEILRWSRFMGIRNDFRIAVAAGNVIMGFFLLYILVTAIWERSRVISKP